jgi:hypothetical protein
MSEAQKLFLFAITLVASVTWFVVWLLMHRRATRMTACHWRERPPLGDDDFLKGCEIPNEPLRIEVALATRSVIAELGTVVPETIRPDDSFAHDLVQLPFWDSLDWLHFLFLVERACRRQVSRQVFDEAVTVAGAREADLRVRHVVRAVTLAATDRPKKLLLDEELQGS